MRKLLHEVCAYLLSWLAHPGWHQRRGLRESDGFVCSASSFYEMVYIVHEGRFLLCSLVGTGFAMVFTGHDRLFNGDTQDDSEQEQ